MFTTVFLCYNKCKLNYFTYQQAIIYSPNLNIHTKVATKKAPIKKLLAKRPAKQVKKAIKNSNLTKPSRALLSEKTKPESEENVPLPLNKQKEIVIKISDSPMDIYTSPHVLDLSQTRFIEKVRPPEELASNDYSDLPGGEMLEKFYFFEFWDFEKSEVLNFFKNFGRNVLHWREKVFPRLELLPKTPAIDKEKIHLPDSSLATWQEVSIINLFLFIFSVFNKIFSTIKDLRFYFSKSAEPEDEEIEFNQKEILPEELTKALKSPGMLELERQILAEVAVDEMWAHYQNLGVMKRANEPIFEEEIKSKNPKEELFKDFFGSAQTPVFPVQPLKPVGPNIFQRMRLSLAEWIKPKERVKRESKLKFSWSLGFEKAIFKKPNFQMPHIPRPHLPHMPHMEMPHFEMPEVHLPNISMPQIKMPHFEMPHMEMPEVHLPEINWPKFNGRKYYDWQIKQISSWRVAVRPTLIFALIIIVAVILPIKGMAYWQKINSAKGEILGQAKEALTNMKSAQTELFKFDVQGAQSYMTVANSNFVSAQNQLEDVRSFFTDLAEISPINNSFKSGKNLLELGQHLSTAGEHLLIGVELLKQPTDGKLTEKIKGFQKENQIVMAELGIAQTNLQNIDAKYLPEEQRAQFLELKDKMPQLMEALQKFQGLTDFAINFLGDNDIRRYLVIFQNSNELRASGGFMGSFSLVDFKSGQVKNLQLPSGGTYDVRAGLNQLLQAPQPLQIVNARWEFQDTNWWPDWPTTAEKVSWFYEKSGGPTVDGIIAINSQWLGEILKIVGDVPMPEYNKIITADNYEMELQKSVEIQYADKKAPKKILSDLAPKLLEKLLKVQPDKFLNLMLAVKSGLDQKNIMMYLSNSDQEKFASDNNWDGRQKDAGGDYLNVVATNIGGGKTDNVINQNIYHQAKIMPDGSIIDSVVISRYHFGPIDDIFTTHFNRSYLRVYVPEGSKLIKAVGFEAPEANTYKKIDDYLQVDPALINENTATIDASSQTKIYTENGKTVFANWMTLKPGQTQEAVLTYQLPFKLTKLPTPTSSPDLIGRIKNAFAPATNVNYESYSLLIQKQSGSRNNSIISGLSYADNLQPVIDYPQELISDEANRETTFKSTLDTDKFYFVGFKSK